MHKLSFLGATAAPKFSFKIVYAVLFRQQMAFFQLVRIRVLVQLYCFPTDTNVLI